jgi:elongation factor G
MLDLAVQIFPGPEKREVKGNDLSGHETLRNALPDAPFSAQVFKTTIDHFAGRIDYVRIFSGTLKSDSTVMNPRTRTQERVTHFYRTDGAQTFEVPEAGPGEFVVLMKLKDAHTGDTLCDPDAPVTLPPFGQHTRPVSYAVHAKSGDDKAAAALHKLIEEDPSLELTRSPDTGEMLLQGMGQAHIDVTVERVKRKHGVEVTLAPPSPAYLETITASAKAQGKFKRQTGGPGQYGDAHVELHPKARGEGFEFEDAIVGGVIPRQFIPSVEKGIRGALGAGPLAGYPVVDFQAKLVFGSYHDVDSSDMAFQVAGSMAFKKAMQDARPILLEPVMKLEVRVPEEYVGAVMGDLNSRRAKVQGMEPLARGVLVRALCPHAEAMTYDADLRSLTQGVGYFTMEPSHYDPVPPHIAQKIIERRRAEGKVKGVEE